MAVLAREIDITFSHFIHKKYQSLSLYLINHFLIFFLIIGIFMIFFTIGFKINQKVTHMCIPIRHSLNAFKFFNFLNLFMF